MRKGLVMTHPRKKIVIIGAGIAGLSAAAYALKCGYDVDVLEMHDMAGGLAMSWKRGGYTFETCLHWLVGTNPKGEFHELWREVFEIDKLRIIDHDEFVRVETDRGEQFHVYASLERLEQEMLRRAPQDAAAIQEFVQAVRTLAKFRILDPTGGLAQNWKNLLHDLPVFPVVAKLGKMSGEEYGSRFSDPLLREFFAGGDLGRMSAIVMPITMAWLDARNAGYCIGGAQAIIRLIEEKIASLGGKVRFGARVKRILAERNTAGRDEAVGVELESGETVGADWVISAADGHATVFNMLGGRYVDDATRKLYAERRKFASYLQVSLGVAMDLSALPPMTARMLDEPLCIDPETELPNVSFRFFHFDPTFAPPGKTAVTCMIPTRNDGFWTDLRRRDPVQYHAEKRRVAEMIVNELEQQVAGVREAIEVVDVSTPATVIRYTGNWQGSMEGWLMEPGRGFRSLPNTLPGLERFYMVGQWVMPGGGLPSGPMTAKPAVKAICKADQVPFVTHEPAREEEMVAS
jgi:phytoene dehydrogenase-like protein